MTQYILFDLPRFSHIQLIIQFRSPAMQNSSLRKCLVGWSDWLSHIQVAIWKFCKQEYSQGNEVKVSFNYFITICSSRYCGGIERLFLKKLFVQITMPSTTVLWNRISPSSKPFSHRGGVGYGARLQRRFDNVSRLSSWMVSSQN